MELIILGIAAISGDATAGKALLKCGAHPDAVDHGGNTPLMVCASIHTYSSQRSAQCWFSLQ
jgi:ankyrin repeat protein